MPGETRAATIIWAEGSRLAADIFRPAPSGNALPAVLLCHGWGGLKSHLANYARRFAEAGFISLVFDYRGWGESDGKLIPTSDTPMLTTEGSQLLRVRVVREVVDPQDQVLDVRAALAVLLSERGVDPERVGIWGTSYGAGHAALVAAIDPRIKALVAQIGGYDHPQAEWFVNLARKRAVDRARGLIDPPIPQGIDVAPGLKGTPDVAKQLGHRPVIAARDIRIPTLVIDAEFEELNNRHVHGEAVYNAVRPHAPAEYVTYPCKHYGVYDAFFEPSVAQAIAWFRKYL